MDDVKLFHSYVSSSCIEEIKSAPRVGPEHRLSGLWKAPLVLEKICKLN